MLSCSLTVYDNLIKNSRLFFFVFFCLSLFFVVYCCCCFFLFFLAMGKYVTSCLGSYQATLHSSFTNRTWNRCIGLAKFHPRLFLETVGDSAAGRFSLLQEGGARTFYASDFPHPNQRTSLYDNTFSSSRSLLSYQFLERLIWFVGLGCLTPPSAIFQLYRGGQFYWWRNPSTRRKLPSWLKSLTNFIT